MPTSDAAEPRAVSVRLSRARLAAARGLTSGPRFPCACLRAAPAPATTAGPQVWLSGRSGMPLGRRRRPQAARAAARRPAAARAAALGRTHGPAAAPARVQRAALQCWRLQAAPSLLPSPARLPICARAPISTQLQPAAELAGAAGGSCRRRGARAAAGRPAGCCARAQRWPEASLAPGTGHQPVRRAEAPGGVLVLRMYCRGLLRRRSRRRARGG